MRKVLRDNACLTYIERANGEVVKGGKDHATSLRTRDGTKKKEKKKMRRGLKGEYHFFVHVWSTTFEHKYVKQRALKTIRRKVAKIDYNHQALNP